MTTSALTESRRVPSTKLGRLRFSSAFVFVASALCLVSCSTKDGPENVASRNGSSPSNAPVLIADGSSGAVQHGSAGRSGSTLPSSSTGTPAAASAPGSTANSLPMVSGMIDDCGDPNPAGLSPDEVKRLAAGGPGAPRLLYPYDETVFPRGMMPPALMWDGPKTDAVYVHLTASQFEWRGCVRPTADNQLVLPEFVWTSASQLTRGAQDPYRLELSALSEGNVAGPTEISFTIAQATIKGSIYYNSYISSASFSGSILRIPHGGKAEPFLSGAACYGCHTVSANGERLITHTGGGDTGSAFAIAPAIQPNPPQLAPAPMPAFSGLSPDGSVYVATAHPPGNVRPQGTPMDMNLVNDASLYETDTGMPLAGTGVPAGAMMPTFSPSGTMLTFNDVAIAGGRGLAVMDFDAPTRKFTNHRVVFTDSDRYPGWPFFLPDAKAIIFSRGVNSQFSGGGVGIIDSAASGAIQGIAGAFPGLIPGLPTAGAGGGMAATPAGTPGLGAGAPESDLYMVDLATGATTILARAMGLTSPTDTAGYVPFGADDLHHHYYPTVSPVAAGGYFWVFFDSIRNYGNLGAMRQLWGTAISISPDGDYSTDRSSPAFYLPGQELGTGNHRAFAALDACVMDGERCSTGIDCCGGFCFIPDSASNEFGDPVGTCTSDTPQCAKRDERCVSDADCCAPMPGAAANSCIAGFCAFIDLQ